MCRTQMSLYLTIILPVLGIRAAIDHSIGYFPKNVAPGLESIGIEPFLNERAAKQALGNRDTTSEKLKIYLNPVHYKGEPLFGWFRVQTKIKNGGVRWFAIQAESKNFKHSAGEFFFADFNSDTKTCSSGLSYSSVPSDPEKLTKSNFLPSLYSPSPSTTVPVGFVYKTVSSNPSLLPSEFNLLWRMNLPLCGIYDNTNPLLFRGYALNEDESVGLFTAETPEVQYKNFLYGAHDPKPPKNAALSCNAGKMPLWAKVATNTMNLGDELSTCSDALKNQYHDHFYGRCNIYRNSSKPSEVYECKGNNEFYWALPSQVSANLIEGRNFVDPVEDDNHDSNTNIVFCIGPYSNCDDIYENLTNTGISTVTYLGVHITAARKAHGIMMIIVTFFLIPVTSFTTRYFKETFITKRILHNHIWYFVCVFRLIESCVRVHFVGVTHAFVGIVASVIVAAEARSIYGTSRKNLALIHRLFGWATVGTFMLIVLLNGLRITQRIPSLVCIFTHFLLGTLVYFGCIAVCVLSCYIPASPSSEHKISAKSDFEIVTLLAILWIVFDIAMHIVMMFFVERFDWEMDLAGPRFYIFNRYVGLMFFPVISIDEAADAPGRLFREYMLAGYTVVAFGNTLLLSILVGHPSEQMFFGPMELTHDKQGNLLDPQVLPAIRNP